MRSDQLARPGSPAAAVESRRVLGTRIDATSYEDACHRIVAWAQGGHSKYICVSNVHMVMEAHDDPEFQEIVNAADLVTPDGVPLVWALRLMGLEHATRVYGPDLLLELCAAAERAHIPVGLLGGTGPVTADLASRLRDQFPNLEFAFVRAPAFSSDGPGGESVEAVSLSGAKIVFVALGCPKQERWMARHRDRIPAVMVGVGAAFDFLSGRKPQAPRVLQRLGLEWAFRLITEPRRLWRRYAVHNPRFVALLAWQLVKGHGGK